MKKAILALLVGLSATAALADNAPLVDEKPSNTKGWMLCTYKWDDGIRDTYVHTVEQDHCKPHYY